MTNKEIGSVLKETSALIELTGGNPFRSRAMANAGRIIQRLEDSVSDLLQEGTLTDIRGIGAGLADQLGQLLATGSFEVREELLSSIPPGLLDMLAVKGLGAKKVRTLWKTMGIQTLDELEVAASSGLIATQEGFGEKSEISIRENVAALRLYRKQRHYADAFVRAMELVSGLEALDEIDAVDITGDLRRKMETVAGIELVLKLASPSESAPIEERFGKLESTNDPHLRVIRTNMPDGFPLTLWMASPQMFGTKQFELTGSEPFLQNWSKQFGKLPEAASESTVFDTAGLPDIPPELREDDDIIERAKRRSVPVLIENSDLKGTLHNHSTYSDGAHSLAEMALAARNMDLSYFGICDHSQSLRIANGLMPEDVKRQQNEIGQLNEAWASDGGPAFRLFSGIESDILSDGSLDYSDEILESFDFVVASVHIGFNMTESEATERVVHAVSNPFTRILGHPTGRLLLRRKGYPLNHEIVLDACAEFGVAVELNANPYRLDLDWRWIRAATDRGILISINPDAHAIDQLGYTKWGVAAARKGYLTADSCLNAMSLDAFSAWINLH